MRKNKIMSLFLILSLVLIYPVKAQDITKLVRIQPGDSWVYETPEGFIQYNVTQTWINAYNQEVNELETNLSEPPILFEGWVIAAGNLTITIEYYNFTLHSSTRGNFINMIRGAANVTILYNDNIYNFNLTEELWRSEGSHNLAIVTGEVQQFVLEYDLPEPIIINDERIYLDIELKYRITPSDPFNTTFQASPIRAVNLTEELKSLDISLAIIDVNESGKTYNYFSDNLFLLGQNKYVYANEIGLPIEIIKNLVAPSGGGRGAGILTNIERLISYEIEESRLIKIEEDTPFIFIPFLIALVIMSRTKRRWRLSKRSLKD